MPSRGTRSDGPPPHLRKSTRSHPQCWRTTTRRRRTSAISPPSENQMSEQLTLSLGEPPASHSASPDCDADSMMTVATWPSSFAALLAAWNRRGWSGKTCPASCQQTEGGHLEPSSGRWANSGMVAPGESWTLNMSEWNHTRLPSPSDGAVCSLSDILETGEHLQRYCLSQRACEGILRRADKRGRKIRPHLRAALEAAAGHKPKTSRD